MKGLEMMLANLIGMKPEDMRKQVEEAISLMQSGARNMAAIQEDLRKIKEHLQIEEGTIVNGARAITNGRGRTNNHSVEL